MYRWPVRLPLSSSNGATPTKAASARRSSRPSSGSQEMRAAIVTAHAWYGVEPGGQRGELRVRRNSLGNQAIELFDRSRDRLQSRRQGLPRRTFRAGGDLVLPRQMLALGIDGNLASLRGRE